LAFFAVPKGLAPERKAAVMKLLHEITVAKNNAAATEVITYSGPSKGLDALLPKEKLGALPTAEQNKSVQFMSDRMWWNEHADEVQLRWQEFKLGL
ncbi:hypothetical protein AB4144_27620, partial [Rhizobiaceae sp. 2RAB30]